jgi:hypothetical protein
MNNIGRTLFGYCNGYFDNCYSEKRIEAEGYDWVVVREEGTNNPLFCHFERPSDKQRLIEEWAKDTRASWEIS